MRILYLISALTLLLTGSAFAQPYIKFEEEPPMQIIVKDRNVNGLKIKYNTPSSGTLYVTLLKDGVAIGNSIHEVTRGKRVLKCNIFIWKEHEITKKGEYAYRAQLLEKKGEWDTTIAKMAPVTGVKAIKKKK